jgi:hypothetical protein
MAIHKLDIGDFDEIDYNLIAIHTQLEDYKLAFLINKKLPILLSKSNEAIVVKKKEGEAQFSRFNYFDKVNKRAWNLFQNKNVLVTNHSEMSQNLFSNEIYQSLTRVYFLPEFKKADYFLKIEKTDDTIELSQIKQIINEIESISTAYIVDIDQIKSKNNLIF